MTFVATQDRSGPTRRDLAGQATVEFALVLLILLSLVYGIIEISKLLLINAELENGAKESSHYAARHPDVTAAYLKANIIAPRVTLIDVNSPEFSVAEPSFPRGGIGPFYPVRVTLNYTWTSMINIMPDMRSLTLNPLGPLPLQASGTSLIEGR